MMRTQVQFTDFQIRALREESAGTDRSISELVREAVDQFLSGRTDVSRAERIERAIQLAGKFASGHNDVGVSHDDYLAEAFGH